MITGKTIICFASGWDYHPTSKHHIMRRLAEHNDVIWVNWHASRRPSIGMTDLKAIAAKLGQIRRGPRQVAGRLTVLTPCQLPLPGINAARQLNARMVRRAIQRVLRHLPSRPVQIWSFAPDVAELVGSFGEELVVYYCVDAFGEFPGYDRAMIDRRERELLDRSGLVLTTSEPLFEAKRALHPNVHMVQHGVDHAHLSRSLHENLPVPTDLRHLPRPLYGFVGVIGNWLDTDIVAGLAKAHPQASIVMIGPEMTPRGACAGLPNVHWLGGRNHAELPAYLRQFDVGLIPFRRVPLTHNANPIKLYEYLSAGVPVVSTSLPAVQKMPESVWLADDISEWAVCCARAARHNSVADRRKRSLRMREESWEARLAQIGALVDETLRSAGSQAPPPDAPEQTRPARRPELQLTS